MTCKWQETGHHSEGREGWGCAAILATLSLLLFPHFTPPHFWTFLDLYKGFVIIATPMPSQTYKSEPAGAASPRRSPAATRRSSTKGVAPEETVTLVFPLFFSLTSEFRTNNKPVKARVLKRVICLATGFSAPRHFSGLGARL